MLDCSKLLIDKNYINYVTNHWYYDKGERFLYLDIIGTELNILLNNDILYNKLCSRRIKQRRNVLKCSLNDTVDELTYPFLCQSLLVQTLNKRQQ